MACVPLKRHSPKKRKLTGLPEAFLKGTDMVLSMFGLCSCSVCRLNVNGCEWVTKDELIVNRQFEPQDVLQVYK